MQPSEPAASVLTGLYADLATRLSAATVTQRRWALAELLRYTASAHSKPEDDVTVGELLEPFVVLSWLYAAENPNADQPIVRLVGDRARPATPASQRARLASLRALADYSGLALPSKLSMPKPARAPIPASSTIAALLGRLAGGRPEGVTPAVWSRFRAMAHLLIDTGAGEGQLAALHLADVDLGTGAVTLRNGSPADPASAPLSEPSRHALAAWLVARAGLTSGLEGGQVTALWVRAAPARAAAGRHEPPGLPLGARGLRTSWRTVIAALEPDLGISELPMRALRAATQH